MVAAVGDETGVKWSAAGGLVLGVLLPPAILASTITWGIIALVHAVDLPKVKAQTSRPRASSPSARPVGRYRRRAA